jgi:hypothetical protein
MRKIPRQNVSERDWLCDEAAFALEAEEDHDEFRRSLNLLAWIIRQEAAPRDLANIAARPDICLIESCLATALEWLVRWDGAINDLVRHELADAITDGDGLAAMWAGMAARLLLSEKPATRGAKGEAPARGALIKSIFAQVQERPWLLQGVRERRRHPEGGTTGENLSALAPGLVSEASFAEAISDILSDALSDLPEADLPTPETIRSALRRPWSGPGCPVRIFWRDEI